MPGPFASAPGRAPASGNTGGELLYRMPETWHEHPPRSPIVYAMFHTDADHGPQTAEVTITPLLGEGGGLLANVNMWRGQVGLPPVSDLVDQQIDKVTVAGRTVDVVVLEGPPDPAGGSALSAAVAIVPDLDRTWFVKLIGPRTSVQSQMRAFIGFVESIRLAGE
jgi:hypothetical protein